MKMQEALQLAAQNPEEVFIRMVGDSYNGKIIGWSKFNDRIAYFSSEYLANSEVYEISKAVEIQKIWLTNEWELVKYTKIEKEVEKECEYCKINEAEERKIYFFKIFAIIIIILTIISMFIK